MGDFKAIQTRYEGCRFRSRLEARWAVAFDYLGLPWEYEKEGYVLADGSKYLPDFWLPSVGIWFEVKGDEPSVEELKNCDLLRIGSGHAVLMVHGSIGEQQYSFFAWEVAGNGGGASSIDVPRLAWSPTRGLTLCTSDPVESIYSDEGMTRRMPFIRCDATGETTMHETGIELAIPRTKFDDACAAGRSARFEYGEKGSGL